MRGWGGLELGTAALLHPTTKHLNRLIWDILVFPCTGVDKMADSSQLTQGGSKVKRPCQSTIIVLLFYHYCIIILSLLDGCVHTLPTHIYGQTTFQVNFASDDPFKNTNHFITLLNVIIKSKKIILILLNLHCNWIHLWDLNIYFIYFSFGFSLFNIYHLSVISQTQT